MSDDSTQQEPVEPKAEEPKSVSHDEIEALKTMVDQLKSSNDRLLGESKDNKAKYQDMRKKQEDAQREDMESKEQWKELLEEEPPHEIRVVWQDREQEDSNDG